MKCCGSSATPGAPNGFDPRTAVADAVQAIVFGEILKPLAKPLGPVGDLALQSVAQKLFIGPRG
jgi:hypothetical protein